MDVEVSWIFLSTEGLKTKMPSRTKRINFNGRNVEEGIEKVESKKTPNVQTPAELCDGIALALEEFCLNETHKGSLPVKWRILGF